MPNLTWKGKMQELRIQFEKQIEDLIEAKSLSEKKLKDVEKLNFNARKKIMTLQKELEGKDKTIGNLKADKAILEEKLDLFSLLVMRSFEFIKDLFSKTPSNSLSLQYMNIEDLFMPELGRILELNPHIEILDLEGNNITDKGIAEFLPSLLAFSGNLTRINLSFNKISANGAWDLFKTLQARENSLGKSIKKLDLSFNIFEEFEIYAKAWEATKEIRVNYPTIKTTKSDFINANSATLSKLFKNLCDKMFDNKEIKQLTYLLDKLEVKQDTEENTIAISIRNKKEIYDAYKSDFDVTARQKLLRNRISQLSLKRARLEDLEKPRELDINLLMAQRPAFILSYIKKTLDSGLKIDTVDKKLDETLLMYACRTNNLNLCKLLVNKLANLEIRNVIF